MKLVIGNKNYSSWSLRPWLLLKSFNLEFHEIQESLTRTDLRERLSLYSGACRVPVFIDGEITVWDSLAICEYVSECYLGGEGWPEAKHDRAVARSLCAEMHAGFHAMREEMPLNCRARRSVTLSDAAKRDIERIEWLWSLYAKPTVDGQRLFGRFSIADCYFAPVVLRFSTYGIPVSDGARAYMNSMLSHPALCEWIDAALLENETIDEFEVGTSR